MLIRMTLATWAPCAAQTALCESIVLAAHLAHPKGGQTENHKDIIAYVTFPAHERDTLRTPYAQRILQSAQVEEVHKTLGTNLFLALLRETLWFVKEGHIFVQVCGRPWKRTVKKDDYFIRRMKFMYALERREDDTYERVSDMCRRVFGLAGRHLKPRYVRLLRSLADFRDHMNDDTPALAGRRAIPFSRIARDLWHYVKRITPYELFGESKFNMRLVRWAIYSLARNGPGKGLSVRPFATLWRLREAEPFTRQMVLDWLKYLLGEVCVKWIRQRYYISERYCFNKETWRREHRRVPERLRPKVAVAPAGATSLPLRLLPKGPNVFSEVRPLVPQRLLPQKLWDLKVAQKVLQLFLPEEVIPNLSRCKRLIRESDATWCVHLDVRFAYDIINQAILWELLNEAVEKGPSHGRGNYVRTNGWKTQVNPRSFPRDALVSDLTTHTTMSKERLLEIIHEVIFENYVIHNGRTFLLQRGIPQGSSLSQLLCSFYLHFAVRPQSGRTLRHTDDQLYLCNSKEECLAHVEDMQNQFVPWNWKKFKMSQREGKWCGIELQKK